MIKCFLEYLEYRQTSKHLDTRFVPYGPKNETFWGIDHVSRYRYLIENFISPAAESKSWLVLDFGCGSGYGAAMLAEHCARVIGLDLSEVAIKYARKYFRKKNLGYLVGDVTSPNLSASFPLKFDLVVSFHVIEHLPEPEKYLKNAFSLLREGGLFIAGTPNRMVSEKHGISNPYHDREYSPAELKDELAKYFSDVKIIGQCFKDKALAAVAFQEKTTVARAGALANNLLAALIPFKSRPAGSQPHFAVGDILFTEHELDECYGLVAVGKK